MTAPSRPLALTVAIAAVILGLLLAAVIVAGGLGRPETAAEIPRPSASTSLVHPAMAVPIPADADCSACHVSGGLAGLRDIPPMAHAVEGWRNCTACHADDRLVQIAPGHTGIGKELCLACHEGAAPDASALPRPHHVVSGTACITCHGSSAPLPTDMAGRTNCWVCHPDADSVDLFGAGARGASP
jgi:hypothetical protein